MPAEDAPLSLRLAGLCKLLLARLSTAPARVLEIGCGDGALARAMARAGHDVTAVDPKAPDGPIFSATTFENLDTRELFDAVVASVSLHHLPDLGAAFDKIARLLRPGGALVVDEFAKERLTGATAQWHYLQRQALAAVGLRDAPPAGGAEAWLAQWHAAHADIHPAAAVRAELDARFTEREFAWTPYLFDFGLRDALEPLERELIELGAIEATGFRYVGERPAAEAVGQG